MEGQHGNGDAVMPSKRPTARTIPKTERQDYRQSAAKRGYGRMHRRWRKMVLHRHPVCNMCKTAPATIADHIVPWQDGGEKYALSNGQGLCQPCHNAKTAEDVSKRKDDCG